LVCGRQTFKPKLQFLSAGNNTNTEILKWEISKFIDDILVGLSWKMIWLSMQGKIAKENQVQALYVYVDELDVMEAKPRLMALYEGNVSINHCFPLHIQIHLVTQNKCSSEYARLLQD